tara:strand:+ start:187 stop:321 length:135 start_codon:yes stop_codon:yes gene_type:complete
VEEALSILAVAVLEAIVTAIIVNLLVVEQVQKHPLQLQEEILIL